MIGGGEVGLGTVVLGGLRRYMVEATFLFFSFFPCSSVNLVLRCLFKETNVGCEKS